jgi:D-3-phosphoglycerate dehydrogenase
MTEKIVLVTDYTWSSTEPEAKVLAQVDARLLVAQTGSEDELLALVPQADAILTCFKKVSAEVIRAGEKLQVVGRYGIGVDNIAVDEATRLGIPVTNVPAYCLDEVAEHVMALLFACARRVCRYNSAVHQGDWRLQTGLPMFRVRGTTLGIIGFGKIGQVLAEKARAFGMNIVAHDAYASAEVFRQHNVESLSLDELLALADFVSIHTPLTPETRHLINAERLQMMKPTGFIINTARGPIIDHLALAQALREGWIAGAGLDVFDVEPLPADHELLLSPNLIATPHVAFYSEESILQLETLAAQNVAMILSGKRPLSVVNPDVLKLSRWAHLR